MPTPDDIPTVSVEDVQTWPPRWSVSVVEETGSTNDDLVAAAATGAADRTVLCARHQVAGRGRLDRRWEAPPGANLLVSVLFREVPGEVHQLTQRIGLAACAVAQQFGVEATLKWPNDVVVGDAKLAGILAQAGERLDFVVVGLGMNVGWAPPGAASLVSPAGTPDVLDVLRRILAAYDEIAEPLVDSYRRALSTIGRRVRVELHDGVLLGTAVDVGTDGVLVVRGDDGAVHQIRSGDVVHLRAASGSASDGGAR